LTSTAAADLSRDETAQQHEWADVVLFSALVLAIGVGVLERGARRLWAAVPPATVLSVVMYVEIGGPLLLVTWACAATACIVGPGRT
jgi:hypothetical protein